MSVPFGIVEYRSTDRFEQEYIEEIQEHCNELTLDHRWWSEQVTLYDKIEYPLYLTGDSRLLLEALQSEHGYREPVDYSDDISMALVDYAKLLEILSLLSKQHELTWKLFQTGSLKFEMLIGWIESGETSESAIRHMTDIMSEVAVTHEDLLDKERQQRIYSKYFDENDKPIFEIDR